MTHVVLFFLNGSVAPRGRREQKDDDDDDASPPLALATFVLTRSLFPRNNTQATNGNFDHR